MKPTLPVFNTFKHCPNCKSDDISSANGHKYLCAQCSFEYFHNTASAVAAIICCGDEILFTVRAQDPGKDKLDLPGGFVDHNESLEQALSRELQEELSITVTNWQYFCSGSNVYHFKGVNYHTCDAIFIAHLEHKPQITLDPSEITEYKWLTKAQIDGSQMAFNSLQQAVDKFISTKLK